MTVLPQKSAINLSSGARKRIAIIGSGISGSAAAWALSSANDITIFEANAVPGGHTATVDINYNGTPISVDTGFIVYNEHNYPNLTALFSHLDVKTIDTVMSFALSLDEGKLEWSGASFTALFAQKRNLVSLSFYKMLREILRFNSLCIADQKSGYTASLSIGDYLYNRKFSANFIDDYLIPMAAAIWSTPRLKMMDFPADAFISFFENHRLIHFERPVWRTVAGGSRNYLNKLLESQSINVRCNSKVTKISRLNDMVDITLESGACESFDTVIMACHSDQALRILSDANQMERDILGAIQYRPNRVILHCDPSLMPKRKRAWSAWNYLRSSKHGGEPEVAVTYWMNDLQSIDKTKPLFVTLNPPHEPRPGTIFGEWTYEHPQFDAEAMAAQKLIPQIQGRGNIWFVGAWAGYGFHEDGLASALEVAEQLGATLPFKRAQARALRHTLATK